MQYVILMKWLDFQKNLSKTFKKVAIKKFKVFDIFSVSLSHSAKMREVGEPKISIVHNIDIMDFLQCLQFHIHAYLEM